MNLEKIEAIAREAERTANAALIAISELQLENAILKEKLEELTLQLNQQKASASEEKCAALIDILAGFFERGERITQQEWAEVRREVVLDDDPDYGEVKKQFAKQGRELFKAVVMREQPEAEVAPPDTVVASEQPPAPQKKRMGGRVSTGEVVRPTVDSLGDQQDALTPGLPTPNFGSVATPVDILPALNEIQAIGSVARLPNQDLGRISSQFRTALIGGSSPTECAQAFKLVEDTLTISPTEKKQVIQWLMEGVSPSVMATALTNSSPLVVDAFNTIFF